MDNAEDTPLSHVLDQDGTPSRRYLDMLFILLEHTMGAIKHSQELGMSSDMYKDHDAEAYREEHGFSPNEQQALMLCWIMEYLRLPEWIEPACIRAFIEEQYALTPERAREIADHAHYNQGDVEKLGPLGNMNRIIDARLDNWSSARMETTPYGEED